MGTTTSLICAVHCALLPLCLSLGYVKASSFMNNIFFEVIVLTLTAGFVFFSIIKPYYQDRNNPLPFILAITGILLIAIHHLIPTHQSFIIVLGGILIAISHMFNLLGIKKAQ